MKVAEYAATWLVDHPRPAESTNKQAGYGIRPFVAACGHRDMNAITYAEARQFALSHRAAAKYARAMFENARSDGILHGANPFAGLRLPRDEAKQPPRALSDAEIHELVKFAPIPRFQEAIKFTVDTGLRRGELLALVGADVRGDELTVSKSLGPDGVTGPTKNGRERVVVLTDRARHLATGEGPDERLFGWTVAQFRSHWQVTRADCAGSARTARWHDLRHTAGTRLFLRCRDYGLVKLQLGHATETITRELYVHLEDRAERERLREVLND